MRKLLLAAMTLALLVVHVPHASLLAAAEKPRSLPAPKDDVAQGRALQKLANPTQLNFIEMPLSDGLSFLADYHAVKIRLDGDALIRAKVPADSPVQLMRDQDPLQRVLNLIAVPLGLAWYVDDGEIVVTTQTELGKALESSLEKRLQPELQIIDYICELTEKQKKKLQLAARGNVNKLASEIDEQAKAILKIVDDEERTIPAWEKMEQLQRETQLTFFNNGSFFRKTIEANLTPEQLKKCDPIRAVLEAGGAIGTLQDGDEVILGIVLIGTKSSDHDFAKLEGLTPLGALWIDTLAVTDKGLSHFKNLTNLRQLSAGATEVTDEGLAHLKNLQKLNTLSLYRCGGVTDAGLVHLSGFKNLRSLNLAGSRVTNTGLAHLKGLPALRELNIQETTVDDTGISELKKACPELQINK